MAKKILTQDTTDYDNIQKLDDLVEDQSLLVKQTFDKAGNDQQTFMNDVHIDEIQDSTEGTSGSYAIGHGSANITADNVGDALEELQGQFADKQDVDNLVTAFQVTPDNTHYPSEKLVKDSLDGKADNSDLGDYYTKTELAQTTDSDSGADKIGATQIDSSPTNVQGVLEYLKTQIDGIILDPLVLPDGSITDVKLSSASGQIKESVRTPLYDTTSDLSGFRSSVLSGNFNGALTQVVSGESATNRLGTLGALRIDSNSDGLADGLLSTSSNSFTLIDCIQSFTATGTNGSLRFENIVAEIGHVYYLSVDMKSDSNLVRLQLSDGVSFQDTAHSGSGEFERISVLLTSTNSGNLRNTIYDARTSGWTEIQLKNMTLIDLTNEGTSGLTKLEADLKYQRYFDNIGHATINQKISGTNGEFELKEPYVLPKDPGGTASEIVTLDGQNFARLKHKQFVIDGNINWSNFTNSTNVYFARTTEGYPTDLIGDTANTGVFTNNDWTYPILASIDGTIAGIRYNESSGLYFLAILKSVLDAYSGKLAGTSTIDDFKSYLNDNPLYGYMRINTLIDIPIKHLGSIEDGTITNNSTILPSSLTYTYPINEAGERESTQIAQNQITTTNGHIVNQNIETIFKASEINTQSQYGSNVKTILGNDIVTILQNAIITTEFIGGKIQTTIREV